MEATGPVSVSRRATGWRGTAHSATAGIALLGLGLCAGPAAGDAPATKFNTPQAKAGYSAGYAFGERLAGLKNQGGNIALEAVFRGILDALAGAEPLMNKTQRNAALDQLRAPTAQKPPIDVGSDIARLPARTGGFKDDFARLNAARESVVVLPSGVQYEVLRPGRGRQPHSGDSVVVNYVGSLTNGRVFDSTREDGKPARLALDEIVVPGMREALQLMTEGAKWRVVIPPAMGFGRTNNMMLRRRDLIYEIELLAVESPAEATPPGAMSEAAPSATKAAQP